MSLATECAKLTHEKANRRPRFIVYSINLADDHWHSVKLALPDQRRDSVAANVRAVLRDLTICKRQRVCVPAVVGLLSVRQFVHSVVKHYWRVAKITVRYDYRLCIKNIPL